ncbi:MAG TPA: sigma-70 family RNA polymerase sigma factor [Chloroflexota bacterium]|nr:sigma-70 family RNA polymerase sigma factor [Chloroflexota bacterium]
MNTESMPVAELTSRCREETAKFRRGEPSDERYCFELIRRAVCARDQAAWEVVLAQYRGMVLAWVRQHPSAAALGEEDDYWVTSTFERFWSAVGPERFGAFPGLAAVLRYLKMCTHSLLIDEARGRRSAELTSLDEAEQESDREADVEALAVGSLTGQDLWSTILRVLPEEVDRRVLYLSFASELKPGEIHERHPELFASVADVYRIKRNALDRLRRSAEIREFLGETREKRARAR